jgi:hypothetical protein
MQTSMDIPMLSPGETIGIAHSWRVLRVPWPYPLNDDLADDFHRWYPNFSHTATMDAPLGDQLVVAA